MSQSSTETTYAIICDVRIRTLPQVTVQALVDRRKSHDMYWTTHSPDLIYGLRGYHFSRRIFERYKHNNPRLVLYTEAYELIKNQQQLLQDMFKDN